MSFQDPIALSLFSSRLSALCQEMGAVLQRSAFSPNIRDRLDYSCAVFDPQGRLCAQAAHIPVHLGSMAWAMKDLVAAADWVEGDMLVVNDPFKGGTHLPDITLIAPVFIQGVLVAFVANRAHHADIGSQMPGSMPVSSRLEEEGIVISPHLLLQAGERDEEFWQALMQQMGNRQQSEGDFVAQISANQTGVRRVQALVEGCAGSFAEKLVALNDYGARLAKSSFAAIPDGEYRFSDVMDNDGCGAESIRLQCCIRVSAGSIEVDFASTDQQVAGNINCPLSVTAAGVMYVFRCLLPPETPACAGAFEAIQVSAPVGSLLNATGPAAVAAGNVETSTRVVDVVLGALAQAIPERVAAASHGSMNNVAMGARLGTHNGASKSWDYYETIGGGAGASALTAGQSARQTHMTNTLNTPVEVLEHNYPLRVTEYAVRRNSGGAGANQGGDGIVREMQFLEPASVSLLTERRQQAPWGLAGGYSAKAGSNRLNGEELPPKINLEAKAGDKLRVETPGGGGYGSC
jgi:N-methylhydantoinase B